MKEDNKQLKITAIGEIYNAGFEILDRHKNTIEPMLMGGTEYIARRGSYLLYYNISNQDICLQKTKESRIDFDKPLIIKFMRIKDLEFGLLSMTISSKIGLDYYECK